MKKHVIMLGIVLLLVTVLSYYVWGLLGIIVTAVVVVSIVLINVLAAFIVLYLNKRIK